MIQVFWLMSNVNIEIGGKKNPKIGWGWIFAILLKQIKVSTWLGTDKSKE